MSYFTGDKEEIRDGSNNLLFSLSTCNYINRNFSWKDEFNKNYRFTPERIDDHLNCCKFVVKKMDGVWRRDRVCKAVEDLK